MSNIIVNEEKWKEFLKWYSTNIKKYDWHPIPMADRVNIYVDDNDMIAYKSFGLENGKCVDNFYIREKEYLAWLKGSDM